jgi:hypothetical protein
MTSETWFRRLSATVLAVVCLAATAQHGTAAEEAERFLQRLREERMFDVALHYLEQMRTSPLAEGDFRNTIDYEIGLTMIAAAGQRSQAISARERSLDSAREALQKFLKQVKPNHPKAVSANRQLARLLSARARIKIDQIEKRNTSPEQKKKFLAEARDLYRQAQKVFIEVEARVDKEQDKYKTIDPKNSKLVEERRQINTELLLARLELPQIVYLISTTHEPGSEEHKKVLTEAAAQYAALYEKYSGMVGGWFFRIGEGRCYKELGKYEDAFTAFKDVELNEGDSDIEHDYKSEALALDLEMCLLPDVKKYAEAATAAEKWEEGARSNERSTARGMAIKYFGGLGSLEHAKTLEPKDKARRAHIKLAKEFLEKVARVPGEHKKDALAKLLDPVFGEAASEQKVPANFDEATDRAGAAWERMSGLDMQARTARSQGDTEKLEQLEKKRDEARDKAGKYYRMALAMTTPETDLDRINITRYYLCYIYWLRGDLYDSAVMGEFLANKYPGAPGAKGAAKIAMAAYAVMNGEAGDDNAFELARLTGIANRISTAWKGQPEADEAWSTLIRAAVIAGDLEKAEQHLAKISAESAGRGQAEIMLGQALWSSYIKATRLPEAKRPPQAELDALLAKARTNLEAGAAHTKKSIEDGADVSFAVASAVLSLARISLKQGDADTAVKWLNDPVVGTLTLVNAGSPVTQRPNFNVETYKAALRACVAGKKLQQAEEIMAQLEESVGKSGDAEAATKLTGIYISLGARLQKQIETLRSENRNDELKDVSKAFEMFLDKIGSRPDGNTFSSLNWVASTFAAMGAGYDTGGTPSAESKRYYDQAAKAYQTILDRYEADNSFVPQPRVLTSVRIRLATSLRRSGKYGEALRVLLTVLKKRETVIDAQIQAAYAYQDWATEKPAYYELARKGSKKHKEIWGWGRIAKRVARNPKYRAVLHEALYNQALCRKEYAIGKSGKSRTNYLKRAEADIKRVKNLYPKMGGDTQRDKYEKLLKSIQELLKGKSSG